MAEMVAPYAQCWPLTAVVDGVLECASEWEFRDRDRSSSPPRESGRMTTREQELIGEHLDYEIKMLHETRKALMRKPVPTGIIANALMESFCIHARNLNEFFVEVIRDDTLKASAFATNEYRRPENPADRQALFKKINKQVSHLTTERTSLVEEKIGTGDREEMYGWVHAFLVHFFEYVRADLRSVWRFKFDQ